MSFEIDPRLQKDSILLGHFTLCQLRLHVDARFPWFILVPQIPAISEVFQLSPEQQQQFWQEAVSLSEQLSVLFKADKMNLATLGNIVPQLHLHCIVRYQTDSAWPEPVWNGEEETPYEEEQRDELVQKVFTRLEGVHGFQPSLDL